MKIPANLKELKVEMLENENGTFMAKFEAHGDTVEKAHRYGGSGMKSFPIEAGEQIVGIKGKSFAEGVKCDTWKSLTFVLKKWLK